MGFMRHRFTNIAALMGGSGAQALLAAETDGLSIDFTDASLLVRDTTTTSNEWNAANGNAQDFWRSRSFTSYSSPSPKITRDSDGYYTYRPHNLVAMSERFDSAYWTLAAATLTYGQTAPDGTATATLFTDTAANTTHSLTSAAVTTTNDARAFTVSLYVKAGTLSFIQLYASNDATVYANFNVATGEVTQTGAGATASITDAGGGWYRCVVTGVVAASSTAVSIRACEDGTDARATTGYLGTGTGTLYFWGAMFNLGQSALTYVPTRAHNLCLQSQTAQTTWTNLNTTETTDSTTAPDGTTTADTIVETAIDGNHLLFQGFTTLTTGLTYTASVYLKEKERTFATVELSDASGAVKRYAVLVNLTTGAAVTTYSTNTPTGTAYTITSVGNGWHRIAVTMTMTVGGATCNFAVGLSDSGTPAVDAENQPTYLGDITKGIYWWGAQLELASSPGKYVTTTTAAVYSANYDLPREWGAANAVTNLCIRSQELANAAWTATSLTVTDNTVAAPIGATTTGATLALVDASSAHSIASTTIAYVSGLTYTQSVYAKANTHNHMQLLLQSGQFGAEAYANFDLGNGVTGTVGSATTATITSVGGGWYRCTITAPATGTGSGSAFIALVSGTTATRSESWDPNSTNSLYAWGAQVEQASTAGTYLHTTSTARTDYFTPTDLSCQGLLVEEARSNICLYARDLTQTNWVKTSATAALTATGVDGGANRASTLTASAANGSAFQRIVSASAARSVSMFVKRRTGTGTVSISHGASTGSELVSNGAFGTDTTGWSAGFGTTAASTFTAAAGVATLTVGNSESGARYVTSVSVTTGKLYRISWAAQTSAGSGDRLVVWTATSNGTGGSTLRQQTVANWNTDGTQIFYGIATAATMYVAVACAGAANGDTLIVDNVSVLEVAETDITSSINSSTWTRVSITNETITNPAVCIKLATSGDAIDIDYVQSEAGTFITSPIYTSSASVTRAVDNIRCATSVMAYSQSAVTFYGKGTPQGPDAFATTQALLSADDATANERHLLYRQSGNPRALTTDGGVQQADIDAGAWAVSTSGKLAASVAANDSAASINGAAVVTDATVTMPTVHTFGVGNLNGGSAFNGHIAQVMILPRAMSDAELQTVTT